MRFISVFSVLFVLLPGLGRAQKKFEIHGLKPGMITREIILYSHAPIDTMIWGGEDEASIFKFEGEYLSDSGEFRVGTDGNNVTQITFIAKRRKVEANDKAVAKALAELTKLYGPPSQDYTNVYHIIRWEWGMQQISLTTAEHGQFYTVALTKLEPLSTPGPDPLKEGKPVIGK